MAWVRENLIEKHLVTEVKKAGGIAYKFVSPGRRSVPDRIVLLPGGRLVFVECKAP
ncbi:VRR-NUC domain-containing protein, partial [Salmonella enterica]|nr:VRR-NUC domain-containing protein [Salmonella enterica]